MRSVKETVNLINGFVRPTNEYVKPVKESVSSH